LIIFTYQGNKAFDEQTKVDLEITEQPTRIEEVDLFTEIAVDKQITSNELRTTVEVKNEIKSPNNNVVKPDDQIQEDNIAAHPATDNEKIELPIQSSGKISSTSKNTLIYNEAQEVYIHSLKNVDYRAYRNRPIKVNNNLEIGIPANLATENDKQEFQPMETTEITYVDYLTKSAEYFSEGQYKTALKRYLTILDTYPDDVNANFYGGLCYFNLGQFDKSHELFRNSYSIGYGNFREESMWFSARANYEMKNDLKAKYFLKKIIAEGGFYSKQAKELLGRIAK
jgi:tetratricopeptide (TPR) repeat protein